MISSLKVFKKVSKPTDFVKAEPDFEEPKIITTPEGDVVAVGNVIGEGAYGTVYFAQVISAVTLPEGKIAVKIITIKSEDDSESAMNEFKIISTLLKNYPECTEYLVCYFGIYQSEDAQYFVIFLEYFDGDLSTLIESTPEGISVSTAFAALRDCLHGLQYLEKIGVAHRDVKDENIFYKQTKEGYKFKLGDYGGSCIREECNINVGLPGTIFDPLIVKRFVDINYEETYGQKFEESLYYTRDDIYPLAYTIYKAYFSPEETPAQMKKYSSYEAKKERCSKRLYQLLAQASDPEEMKDALNFFSALIYLLRKPKERMVEIDEALALVTQFV